MSHRLLLLAAVMVFAGCARKLPTYEKPIARAQFQRVRTTAYTHTESDHLQHGCKTCIGTTLRYDAVHSAAADWSRWPLGTTFRILDTGELCKVDDIGWALSGRNTIDLYKPTRGAMNAWGTRTVNIQILAWGDDREALDILRKRSKYAHVQRMVKDLQKIVAFDRKNPAPVAIAASTAVPTMGADLRHFQQLDSPHAAPTPATSAPSGNGGLRRRGDTSR